MRCQRCRVSCRGVPAMLNRADVAPYDSAVDIQTVKAMLDQRGGAARILRACNTHDDLLQALRDIETFLNAKRVKPPETVAWIKGTVHKIARAALAKATS